MVEKIQATLLGPLSNDVNGEGTIEVEVMRVIPAFEKCAPQLRQNDLELAMLQRLAAVRRAVLVQHL